MFRPVFDDIPIQDFHRESAQMKNLTFIGLLLSATFVAQQTLYAQTYEYIGPDRGLWSNSAYWSGGIVPNSSGHSAILNTHTYGGESATTASYDLANGELSALLLGNTSFAELNILSGTELTLGQMSVGQNTGAYGVLNVFGRGATINVSNFVSVGNLGNGEMNIEDGSILNIRATGMGAFEGQTGIIRASGSGTAYTGESILVGESGHGNLFLNSGADLTMSINSSIGSSSTATGNASISGFGTHWQTDGNFFVGEYGQGDLRIVNGASAFAQNTYVGTYDGSRGEALISDSASRLTTGQLVVGHSGMGDLRIQNRGRATSLSRTSIGAGQNSNGFASIAGYFTRLDNLGSLHIGEFGNGQLSISNQATVTSPVTSIGTHSGSRGTVTLSNSVSSLSSDETFVGKGGAGYLSAFYGADIVTSNRSSIGYAENSFGFAEVVGGGSSWGTNGELHVGESGMGELEARSYSQVNGQFTSIGTNSTGNGRVLVSNAQLTTSELHVGGAGMGSLDVRSAGKVNSTGQAIIGNLLDSSGAVTLHGAGSQWDITDQLVVGASGQGSLSIQNGAKVSSNGLTRIGHNNGGTGTVSVNGYGSELTIGDQLQIGSSGEGELKISSSGKVTSSAGILGASANSSGTANVRGTWDAGVIYSGLNGSGDLSVTGGKVFANYNQPNVITVAAGLYAGSDGAIYLKGGRIESDGYTTIGYQGDGTLRTSRRSSLSTKGLFIGALAGSEGSATIGHWIDTIRPDRTYYKSTISIEEDLVVGGFLGSDGGKGELVMNGRSDIFVGDLGFSDYYSSGHYPSSWYRRNMFVGRSDTNTVGGNFEVRNGSAARGSDILFAGLLQNSTGSITVTGPASRLDTIYLHIGGFGTGSLNIQDSGTVESRYGFVGSKTDGNGFVSIGNTVGGRSYWRNNFDMHIGATGNGEVSIDGSNGLARIYNRRTTYLGGNGSSGTLNLSGKNAFFLTSRFLIGDGGIGNVSISNGAELSSGTSVVGSGSTGEGQVDLVGNSYSYFGRTVWSTGILNVGDGGNGSVHLDGQSGSSYLYSRSTTLGTDGGFGSMSLSGSGAHWFEYRDVVVGSSGVGEIDADSRSYVRSINTFLGQTSTGEGTISLSGGGTRWYNYGSMFVGGDQFQAQGQGELNVDSGGYLKVFGDLVVWSSGSFSIDGGSVNADSLILEPGSNFEMTGGYLTTDSLRADFISLDGGVLRADNVESYTGNGPLLVAQNGGTLSPGDSPGLTTIHGDYQIDGGSILIELNGLTAINEHDQVRAMGDLILNSANLDVRMLGFYSPNFNNAYEIIDVDGTLIGQFVGLGEGSVVGNYDGIDLFITYQGGDGNDIWLYTNAIPEPSTAALLCFLMGAELMRRKR